MTLGKILERVKERLWTSNPQIRYRALKLNIVTDKNRSFAPGEEILFFEYVFEDNITRKNEFVYKVGEE